MTRPGAPKLVRTFRRAAAAAALLVVPVLAGAQEWGYKPGGSARLEYTDNYGLSPINKQSGTTWSVQPFIVGYRRTETSQINLLAGIGYTATTGVNPSNDYWTGRLAVDGSTVVERSSFGYSLGVSRDSTQRTETQQTGVVFGSSNIRTGTTAGANYSYQLTERWNAGVFGSVYQNSYSTSGSNTSNLQDNSGYSAGGNLGYTLTPQTQLSLSASYSYYDSDITTNNSISTQLAATHQYSERLTVSGYGGYFWSQIDATQNVPVCPTNPLLCQLGLVQPVTIPVGTNRNGNGTLFGGSVNYLASLQTTLTANASQNITPSGTGTITKATNFNAYVNHNFSERLRGRAGGTWTESTIPGFNTGTFKSTYYSLVVAGSYNLSDAWLLDFGYRHDYSDQRGLTADANVVFVAIAYNWPGQSMGNWSGLDGFVFPSAASSAGRPPEAIPGQPLGAQTPVPQSAAPAPESLPE